MSNAGAVILAVVLVIFFVAFPKMIGVTLGLMVLGAMGKAIEIGLRSLKNKGKSTYLTTNSQDAYTNTPSNTELVDTASRVSVDQPSDVAITSSISVSRNDTSTPNSQGQQMGNLEDWAYEQVGKELDSNNLNKAAWTKAFAQAGGDDKQTRVLYIKARVEKLTTMEQTRLDEIHRDQEALASLKREQRWPP